MFTKRGTTGNSAERRGRGEQTIQSLEKMAPGTGTDVPFYTAAGRDGAAVPRQHARFVFGGYLPRRGAAQQASFTITVAYSRYLIRCQIASHAKGGHHTITCGIPSSTAESLR